MIKSYVQNYFNQKSIEVQPYTLEIILIGLCSWIIRMPLAVAFPACCHWLLLNWIGSKVIDNMAPLRCAVYITMYCSSWFVWIFIYFRLSYQVTAALKLVGENGKHLSRSKLFVFFSFFPPIMSCEYFSLFIIPWLEKQWRIMW